MLELGRKSDIYTGGRCLAGGMLLGRAASGLNRWERALENNGGAYGVYRGARPVGEAARDLEKLFPKGRLQIKALMAILEPHSKFDTSFGFDSEKASQGLIQAKKLLADVAQLAVKDCGRRRPEEGEGEALLSMKRIKRAPRAPRPAVEVMDVPAVSMEVPEKAGTGLVTGLVAGVLGLIGITFLMGRF